MSVIRDPSNNKFYTEYEILKVEEEDETPKKH